MFKYILALCLLSMAVRAEFFIVQLPITVVGTNSTATIDSDFSNKGVVTGWYIDVAGSESASFTSTVSAVHSTKGARTLASGVVASVAAPAITNATSFALFDEKLRLSFVSPAGATNSVTVNAVILYEK